MIQHEAFRAHARTLYLLARAARDKEHLGLLGDQFIALSDIWPSRRNHALHAQLSRCLRNRNVRAPERPAARERKIHPQPEFPRFLSGEAQSVQKLVGKIREVAKTRL